MAEYRLVIKRSATKEIDQISSLDDRRRIVERITALANDPRPHEVKKLVNSDTYRVRTGNFRILYDIDDDKRIVTIVRIGDCRDVYE